MPHSQPFSPRHLTLLLLTLLGVAGLMPHSHARFLWHETQKVPIRRLFANLEQRLERNPADFLTTYQLARLHALAYASNPVSFDASTNDMTPVFATPGSDRGVPGAVTPSSSPESRRVALQHLTNSIALYERAMVLFKQSTNASIHVWLVLPLELGHAWCLDQAGRRDAALAAYRRTLKIAWKKEVEGEFDLKQWVQDRITDVQARRNPLRGSTRRGYIGPGPSYSQEAIGYLLKLLDPARDKREIDRLQEDLVTLQGMGRAVTPLLIPVGRSTALAELTRPDAAVPFDLDGSGLPKRWGWITPQAAWLVFDADGSGQISSGLQLFGNVTFWVFWRDGYDALSSLDADGNGLLEGAELSGLALWRDINSNGISDPDEVQPLTCWGINAISCTSRPHPTGIPWNPRGVRDTEGRWRPTFDWVAAAGE